MFYALRKMTRPRGRSRDQTLMGYHFHSTGFTPFSINVSRSRCNRSVLNDCEHVLNQCEQDGGFVINESEQEIALLSITAVYVLNPPHLQPEFRGSIVAEKAAAADVLAEGVE